MTVAAMLPTLHKHDAACMGRLPRLAVAAVVGDFYSLRGQRRRKAVARMMLVYALHVRACTDPACPVPGCVERKPLMRELIARSGSPFAPGLKGGISLADMVHIATGVQTGLASHDSCDVFDLSGL